MVVALHCKCKNACVNVAKAPVEATGGAAQWLSALPPLSGVTLVLAHLSVGGIQSKVEELLRAELHEQGTCTWKLVSCANCSVFLMASNNENDDVFLNQALTIHAKSVNMVSPVWDIVLEDNGPKDTELLDVPDPSDVQRHEVFKRLRDQAEAFLEQKEIEVEERIRQFSERQRAQLRQLQTQVYREQRILWRRVDDPNAFLPVTLPPKKSRTRDSGAGEATAAGAEPRKVLENVKAEEREEASVAGISLDPSLPPPPDSPAPLPPPSDGAQADNKADAPERRQQTWLASRVKKAAMSSGDLVFSLDDDESQSDGEVGERYGADEDDSLDGAEEDGEVDVDDFYEPRPASVYQIASSLPVQIPSALLGGFGTNSARKGTPAAATASTTVASSTRRTPTASTAVPLRQGRPNPIASTYQASSGMDSEEDMMLSKSFAVPDNRDAVRRRKFVF